MAKLKIVIVGAQGRMGTKIGELAAANPRLEVAARLDVGSTVKDMKAGKVVIDFSLANATLKGDGGDFRVRYIIDDGEMQWLDRWQQVVLTGWTPGEHTIRLELIGPDGWPYRNGDFNVVTKTLGVRGPGSAL